MRFPQQHPPPNEERGPCPPWRCTSQDEGWFPRGPPNQGQINRGPRQREPSWGASSNELTQSYEVPDVSLNYEEQEFREHMKTSQGMTRQHGQPHHRISSFDQNPPSASFYQMLPTTSPQQLQVAGHAQNLASGHMHGMVPTTGPPLGFVHSGPPPGFPPPSRPPSLPPSEPPPGMSPVPPPPGMLSTGQPPPPPPPPVMPQQGMPLGMAPLRPPPQRHLQGPPPNMPTHIPANVTSYSADLHQGIPLPHPGSLEYKHLSESTINGQAQSTVSASIQQASAQFAQPPHINQKSAASEDHHQMFAPSSGSGNSKSSTNKTKNQNEDQKWIEEFAKSRKQQHVKQKMCEMTIPKAHGLLKEAFHLRQILQGLLAEAEGKEVTGTDCGSISVKYEDVKKRLNEIEAIFNDENCVASLKRRIRKIQTKRASRMRRRQRVEHDLAETLVRRKELEARLDLWQASLIQKELDVKKAEELKAAADCVLSEVRRKQLETTRGLDLLEALAKLRDVRCMKAEQKGMQISLSADEMFKKRSEGLRELLTRQMATYMEEDKALKVMMDMEQEETKEREREMLQIKEEKKLHTYKENITEMLFGKTDELTPDDPSYSHREYHESAQHYLESFIQIRHDWDVYAVGDEVDGGSSLPMGWVVPTEPSNETWASALKDNQLTLS